MDRGLAAVICALAVSTWAVADCTCAFAAILFCGRVIQILLRDGLLLCERSVAVHIELRPALIGFRHGDLGLGLRQLSLRLLHLPLRLRQLTFGLIQHGLKGPRIDLKQQLALLDESALFVRLLEKIAGNLRLDVGVNEPIQRADPFAINRHIFLLDRGDLHFERRCICCYGRLGGRPTRWYLGRPPAPTG